MAAAIVQVVNVVPKIMDFIIIHGVELIHNVGMVDMQDGVEMIVTGPGLPS